MRQSVLIAIVLMLVLPALAAVPETMSYQGVLKDAGGTPVPDATYTVTFRLYDVATGGTELWTETQSLATSGGLFDAILGSVAPLTLTFDEPYWLGIQIESDPELDPRTELASAPYALRAKLGDLTLPYSGVTSDPGAAFEIRNNYGTSIKGVSPMTDPFTASVSGGDTTGNVWGALGYRDGALSTWGVFTPNDIYAFGDIMSGNGDGWFAGNVITGGFQMDTGPSDGYVLTSDASGFGTWQPPSEFTLPYSDTTCVGGPAFEVTAYCGSGINGVSYFASPGAYGVRGTDITESVWGALAYDDPGERRTWGVYTTGDLFVGGTSIKYPNGAADGYVLTSNSMGSASWQQLGPAGLADPMDFGSQTWDWDFTSGKLDMDITAGSPVLDITNSSTDNGSVALLRSTSTAASSGATIALWVTTQKGRAGTFKKYTADGYSAVDILADSPTGAGLYVSGTITSTSYTARGVETSRGTEPVFAAETTEPEIYDSGEAYLSNGRAAVSFDRLFTEAVTKDARVRVTVTPVGGWSALFIESTGPSGFVVRSADGDPDIEFFWTAVGLSKDHETGRRITFPDPD